MLTKRYLPSAKNLPSILKKIVQGTAPEKFTNTHLKSIGFKSSNDQAVIPLLKELGFLTSDGTPTDRYHEYRDPSRSKIVMAEAIHTAYDELFHINERPTEKDRDAIKGRFKSTHNISDSLAEFMTKTFYALLKLADLTALREPSKIEAPRPEKPADIPEDNPRHAPLTDLGGLNYNIQIHLPATKDVEVFNAIFKSLREHLLE